MKTWRRNFNDEVYIYVIVSSDNECCFTILFLTSAIYIYMSVHSSTSLTRTTSTMNNEVQTRESFWKGSESGASNL